MAGLLPRSTSLGISNGDLYTEGCNASTDRSIALHQAVVASKRGTSEQQALVDSLCYAEASLQISQLRHAMFLCPHAYCTTVTAACK